MIRNWNDDKNDVFNFRPRSKEASRFEASKRGNWMQKLPRFNDEDPNDEDDNLSPNLLTHSLLSLIMKILLPVFTASGIGHDLCQWALEH